LGWGSISWCVDPAGVAMGTFLTASTHLPTTPNWLNLKVFHKLMGVKCLIHVDDCSFASSADVKK